MYSVTQEYINKLLSVGAKRRFIRGTIDGVAFDEGDVVMKTLKYTKQCVNNSDVKLGGVFLGQLSLTFTKAFSSNIARGTWDKKVISLEIGLEIDPEEDPEFVPVGVYKVHEADHNSKGVSITAYDNMYAFDKELSLTTTSGSLYSLATYVCDKCHVSLGMTREEFEALPNGDEVVSIYPDNDMTTFRDLVSWIAVTMCGYATIDREGGLIFKNFNSDVVFTLGIDDRYEGASFSDFVTRYTGVSFGNIAEQTTTYIHVNPDNALTMSTGMNPLMQYGLDETKARMRLAILNGLQDFAYTPFKVSAFADPCFDLGDVIEFTGGLAGTSINSCIMRMDFSYIGGMTMQGYGKNPSLFGAQSKTDKDISGLMSQNKANEIKFVHYTNIEDVYIYADNTDAFTTLATLELSSDREGWAEVETTLIFQASSKLALSENAIRGRLLYEHLRFELDGELVSRFLNTEFTFSAKDTAYDYAIEHYFAIRMGANERKTLTLKISNDFLYAYTSASGGTRQDENANSYLYIGENGLNVYVKGQCLSETPSWDGLITLADEITMYDIGFITNKPVTESVEVQILDNEVIDLAEEVGRMNVKGIGVVDMAESISIVLTRPTYNITDESGEYNIVTEDGDSNITTE